MASRLFFLCARGSGRALLAASLLQSTAGNRFEIWSSLPQDTQEQALIEHLTQEQGVALLTPDHPVQWTDHNLTHHSRCRSASPLAR